MSTSELLDQLAKLKPSEREKVWQKLEELQLAEIEETPEMLKAIDVARASVREGKKHSVEDARKLLVKWTTKSS